MIGYHYTTQEAWNLIQVEGMHPAPIRQHEYDRFASVCKDLPRDAIWVWKEELTDTQAFITALLLADIHSSFDFVLLEIEYDAESSASLVCKECSEDTIKLSCNFSAGNHLFTGSQPIDLIINSVPAASITKLWQGDLLEPLRNRHPARETVLC